MNRNTYHMVRKTGKHKTLPEHEGIDRMTLTEILKQVQEGTLSLEDAQRILKQDGYKEMDYAKLDTGRKARTAPQGWGRSPGRARRCSEAG